MFSQNVMFRVGSHVSDLTAVVRALSPGVDAVTWFSGYWKVGTGDGLFVDAERASARWCAVADVLIHPGSMRTVKPQVESVAMITAYACGRDEWRLCMSDGVTNIEMPHRDLLPCLAAVYGWAVYGNSPTTWSFDVR